MTSISMPIMATRAGHTLVTFTANVTSAAKYVQFHVYTGTTKTSACLTPSGGIATFAWDGTDGSSSAQADSSYTWDAVAYPMWASGCSGAAQTMSSNTYLSRTPTALRCHRRRPR